jgi:acylphosphatase
MPLKDTAASALNASTKNGNLTGVAEELADGVNIAANGPKPTVEEQWHGPDKENGGVDAGEDDDDANNATPVLEEVAPKKKKKKRKPKSARKNVSLYEELREALSLVLITVSV